MNGQFEMRERLMQLIASERGGVLPAWMHDNGVRVLAERLLAGGALMPPVKLGQTVYAVLFEGDDAEIWPWSVCGFAFMEGKWYAVERDGSEWEVGGACCHLSEEAAEQYKQREMEKRTVTGPCKEERENAEVTNEAD